MTYGVTVKETREAYGWRSSAPIKNGLIYAVPAEASWVCRPENLHAHALAGFLRELVELGDPTVRGLMQRWGLYYRPRPIEAEEAQT